MLNNLKELVEKIVSFYLPNIYAEILINNVDNTKASENSLRNHKILEKANLVVALNGCSLTIQYIQNHNPNVIIIHLCDKTVERVGSLFSYDELEFYDKLGFELTNTYENLTGQSISDWWE